LFTDTYLNILFSKSNYWNYAVFQWSDARLTSAYCPKTTGAYTESLSIGHSLMQIHHHIAPSLRGGCNAADAAISKIFNYHFKRDPYRINRYRPRTDTTPDVIPAPALGSRKAGSLAGVNSSGAKRGVGIQSALYQRCHPDSGLPQSRTAMLHTCEFKNLIGRQGGIVQAHFINRSVERVRPGGFHCSKYDARVLACSE